MSGNKTSDSNIHFIPSDELGRPRRQVARLPVDGKTGEHQRQSNDHSNGSLCGIPLSLHQKQQLMARFQRAGTVIRRIGASVIQNQALDLNRKLISAQTDKKRMSKRNYSDDDDPPEKKARLCTNQHMEGGADPSHEPTEEEKDRALYQAALGEQAARTKHMAELLEGSKLPLL